MSSSSATGASRRSHTKSRKGCKTCKRRHIRCDETFPQCRNCAKHQVRCDYMDLVAAEEAQQRGPPVPDLYWSPEIENILDHWQRSGYCALGDFSINLHAGDHTYSKSDLHLMYHALWSGNHNVTNEFTVWTGKTPRFLEVATSQPFLVHAILGFGSLAVAWERNSTDAKALAYQHGATALQGLQQAIGSFSRENADAVLATSILLSWQANDWRSWASLVAGIRTLMGSMQSWRGESMLTEILDEQEYSIPQDFPRISPTPTTDESRRNHGHILQQIYISLEALQPNLINRADGNYIEQLKDYIHRLLSIRPAQTPEEEFNHLYAFRKWLFWIPATLLRSENRDYMTLVVLAYFYATALSFESIYPTVASAFCSTMALKPLEEIFQSFKVLEQSPAFYSQGHNNILQLLDWPRQVAATYRQRKGAMSMQCSAISPPAFEILTSDLANVYNEHGFGSQPSPAFVPSPKSRVSSDLSSHGSPYLEVPISSSTFGGTYQQHSLSLPSMSSGFDLDDSYGAKASMDWAGFVNSPPLWT